MKAIKDNQLARNLVNIGLTHDEAACYVALLSEGSLDAKKMGTKINVLPNAVYRLMDSLVVKGFIVDLHTSPKTYQAIPPAIAIDMYCEKEKTRLEKVKLQAINTFSTSNMNTSKTRIDSLTGRDEVYSKAIEFTNSAQEEVLVISIGSAVPDEIKLAHIDAKDRGLTQKLIFQKYNVENKDIIDSWARMGIEVRHFPDSGYHLMVYDSKKSILVATNQENTAERAGMVIYSEKLSSVLRTYFYSVWEKATVILRNT